MGARDETISLILYEMVGNEGIKVIRSLSAPSTDLMIQERTQIPITRVRATLNLLHKHNIVSYDSDRDAEKGWFKYTWVLCEEHIHPSTINHATSKLMRLRRELQEISDSTFFKCENECERITFTEAYDNNFRCQKCNAMLKPVDPIAEGREIKKEMEEIKAMLELIGPLPSRLQNA